MKIKATFAVLTATTLVSAAGFAQGVPAPAPDTWITMGADLFSNGASSNFQTAMKNVIDDYYIPGDCLADDDPMTPEDESDYKTCDDLRFGFTVHAGRGCDDTSLNGPLAVFYRTQEDGGELVKGRVMSIHGEYGGTYCGNDEFVNHDTALVRLWETTFPGSTSSTPIGDGTLDDYWERPHLTLFITKSFPQTTDATAGADDRIIESLRQACRMYNGQGLNPLGDTVNAILPSMPTWVMTERRSNEDEALYGGLLAGAGGTADCEYKIGASWDPIDVCLHIEKPGVSEATIRRDIQQGDYRCGAGPELAKTGAVEGERELTIRCHLGDPTSCGTNDETDLLGLFACVRQVPRGIEVDDNLVVRYCQNGDPEIYQDPLLPLCGTEDPPGAPCCNVLRESQGDIEFIDENRTLFVITDRDNCDGTAVDVFPCPLNESCDTGGVGRCADGHIECPDNLPVCVPTFQHYPEICNGLDDDCDGEVDNISKSWDKPLYDNYTLEDEYAGLACNELDVCVCPGGATDVHIGGTFVEYQAGWSPVCECGEGLAPAEDGPQSMGEPTDMSSDPQAGCSAAAGRSLPASFVGLFLLGVAGLMRRRR